MGDFVEIVKNLMLMRGISQQKQLATLLDVDATHVCKVFKGESGISGKVIQKIVLVFSEEMNRLGLTLDDLVRASVIDRERDPVIKRCLQRLMQGQSPPRPPDAMSTELQKHPETYRAVAKILADGGDYAEGQLRQLLGILEMAVKVKSAAQTVNRGK